jgi:predicted nucleotidyltransferase
LASDKLRYAIAFEAARLMYQRVESEYYTAKRKAAKRVCRNDCKPEDLPSNAEIREVIQSFARLHEGESRTANLRQMRVEALKLMRLLRSFKPRLIGSVMTGHIRKGSDIDIHLFTDSPALVTGLLESENYQFDLERKEVLKHNEARVFTHVHVYDRFNYELTIYPEDKAHYVFKSSITGKAIERASVRELEELMAEKYPGFDVEDEVTADDTNDPYPVFRMLLLPLECVKQPREWHPEGDALYHSLQVFELARDERPYDEELLLAALLHDVGKGIEPCDHVAAGLQALDGLITDRTRFLIANHMLAHDYRTGTLPAKQRQRLKESPDFDDLILLERLDMAGRVPGAVVGTVDDALEYLRELARENG